jgi:hypothetical protein
VTTHPPQTAGPPPKLDKSFGFDTAVEQAQLPLLAAKTEASSALRGIGLVKVRGSCTRARCVGGVTLWDADTGAAIGIATGQQGHAQCHNCM